MSPEQLLGKSGEAGDIYSLGVVLYEMLSGEPPFQSGDIPYQIREVVPEPLKGISSEVSAIVMRCLEKKPERRFGSVRELREALDGTAGKTREEGSRKLEEAAEKGSEKNRQEDQRAIIDGLVADGNHAFNTGDYNLAILKWKEAETTSDSEKGIADLIRKARDRQAEKHAGQQQAKVNALLTDAAVYVSSGRYASAEEKLREVLALQSENERAQRMLADCREKQSALDQQLKAEEMRKKEAQDRELEEERRRAVELLKHAEEEKKRAEAERKAAKRRQEEQRRKVQELRVQAEKTKGNAEGAGLGAEKGRKDSATERKTIEPKQHREEENALFQHRRAQDYESGRGVPQSYAEALKWYRKAADQGLAQAQNNLGVLYFDGKGVARNEVEAVIWFRKAAAQGLAMGQFHLGVAHENARGVQRDYAEALTWYRKAADQNLALAQNNLGVLYLYGKGVTRNEKEAVAWFRKAAAQGLGMAQHNLGFAYQNGKGVPLDFKEAEKWYRKAADNGCVPAQERVKKGFSFWTNWFS
jgi:TPR repeat protein